MTNSIDPLWYALVLRSRFEKKSHACLIDRGIESFLPLIEELHVWSDRKKLVEEPLFRGYLFVHTNLRRKVEILETTGVVRFVEFSGKPVCVPDYQIEWVRSALQHPREVQREPYYSAGDRVRVTSGPLTGLEGYIIETRGHARLVITLSSIAQSFSVEITEDCVEKVTAEESAVANFHI
ncbi:MAG TPA: UpxY family transcription antiterminator [Bacteroidota bacterium]|nr:UpxY family transcription antiterminator [Bacteroidota bacterium]